MTSTVRATLSRAPIVGRVVAGSIEKRSDEEEVDGEYVVQRKGGVLLIEDEHPEEIQAHHDMHSMPVNQPAVHDEENNRNRERHEEGTGRHKVVVIADAETWSERRSQVYRVGNPHDCRCEHTQRNSDLIEALVLPTFVVTKLIFEMFEQAA